MIGRCPRRRRLARTLGGRAHKHPLSRGLPLGWSSEISTMADRYVKGSVDRGWCNTRETMVRKLGAGPLTNFAVLDPCLDAPRFKRRSIGLPHLQSRCHESADAQLGYGRDTSGHSSVRENEWVGGGLEGSVQGVVDRCA